MRVGLKPARRLWWDSGRTARLVLSRGVHRSRKSRGGGRGEIIDHWLDSLGRYRNLNISLLFHRMCICSFSY